MKTSRRTTVELIATCKGRAHHLKESWPLFVRQRCPGFDFRAVVVNYGCPDEWPEGVKQIVVKDGVEFFSAPRSKNIAACDSTADILFFCDADFLLPCDFVARNVQYMLLNRLDLLVCADAPGEFFGCYFVTREAYHKVRGFDESFGTRYGFEDTDFLWRIRRYPLRWNWLIASGLEKLPHPSGDSVKYMQEKETSDTNLKRMQDLKRPINPDGYGHYERLALKKLRDEFPWPEYKPEGDKDNFAEWFGAENRKHLQELIAPGTGRLIVELGTSLGVSCRAMLDFNPDVEVISIDNYSYQGYWQDEKHGEGSLRRACQINCWDYRNRLTLVHMDSADGLAHLHELGLQPHLIYVDADHAVPAARRDIDTSMSLFPEAILTGDDYTSVWPAIEAVFDDQFFVDRLFWRVPQ